MSKKILVIGSSNMNLSMNMFKMPEAGQTLTDDGGVAYTPGGIGGCAAIAFSRLGGHSILCSKLGADVHGQRLYGIYKEMKVDTSYLKVDHDCPTGLSVIMKEGSGDVRVLLYPGANERITSEHIIEAFRTEPDAVYIGLDVPSSIIVAASKIAMTKGIPVFVDASPADKDFPLESLPTVEVFSPNENETFEFTGIMPQGSESSLRAAYALYSKVKCKYIVIKLGARGVFVYDGKHFDMIPAFKADKVVDTSSAGETFTAAMALEYLHNGKNIVGAVTYGAAAAAIAVSRAGGVTSVPTEAEVMEFIKTKRV